MEACVILGNLAGRWHPTEWRNLDTRTEQPIRAAIKSSLSSVTPASSVGLSLLASPAELALLGNWLTTISVDVNLIYQRTQTPSLIPK